MAESIPPPAHHHHHHDALTVAEVRALAARAIEAKERAYCT